MLVWSMGASGLSNLGALTVGFVEITSRGLSTLACDHRVLDGAHVLRFYEIPLDLIQRGTVESAERRNWLKLRRPLDCEGAYGIAHG